MRSAVASSTGGYEAARERGSRVDDDLLDSDEVERLAATALFFQAERDRLADPLHDLVEGLPLGVTAA